MKIRTNADVYLAPSRNRKCTFHFISISIQQNSDDHCCEIIKGKRKKK